MIVEILIGSGTGFIGSVAAYYAVRWLRRRRVAGR